MAKGIGRVSDMFNDSGVGTPPSVTSDDLRQIHQRRIEAHAERETAAALNLLRAFKLGEALRELKE